jgi:hypothetical protein
MTIQTRVGSADSGTASTQFAGGGAIPTSTLHIRTIPWHAAISFCREHHYLRNRTPVCGVHFSFGVFTGTELEDRLIGVLLYMRPAGANRMKDGDVLLELRRMVILDCTTKNAESRVLAVTVRKLRALAPWCKAVIAYSDVEGMGHKGTIYKAAGWSLDGVAGGQTWKGRADGKDGRDRGSLTQKLRWRKTL